MGWKEKLQTRWGVSGKQVIIILIVFACTGTTVVLLKKPVLNLLGVEGSSVLFTILYLIFILPIYNLFLLIYGFIFGQFEFFWNYEKKFFRRMLGKK